MKSTFTQYLLYREMIYRKLNERVWPFVRVVKEMDLKSITKFVRRFKSCNGRFLFAFFLLFFLATKKVTKKAGVDTIYDKASSNILRSV
jgi:hypothetical protein